MRTLRRGLQNIKSSPQQHKRDEDGTIIIFSYLPMLKKWCEKIKPKTIFEYGPGESTNFFLSLPYLNKIISVEHDKYYYNKCKSRFKDNRLELNQVECNVNNSSYATSILNHDEKFDMIFVDGRRRVESCISALQKASSDGCIILHDSYRENYMKPLRPFITPLDIDKYSLVFTPKSRNTIYKYEGE